VTYRDNPVKQIILRNDVYGRKIDVNLKTNQKFRKANLFVVEILRLMFCTALPPYPAGQKNAERKNLTVY
jgi:hypothetical protein